MTPSKPEFTQQMKDNLNKMYKMLRLRFYTKQELMTSFGVGERQCRMMLSHISHKVPLIATSGTNAGYKVAVDKSELELVKQSWLELDSRIEELDKRRQPLIKFFEENRRKENEE